MKKKIRLWAIRQGLVLPKNTKETREAFKFPVVEGIDQTPPSRYLGFGLRRML